MASKAFEKAFSAARANKAKNFSFGGKQYNTKLAKDSPAKKAPAKDKIVSGGSTVGTSMGKLPNRMPKTTKVIPTPRPTEFKGGMAPMKTKSGDSTGPTTRPSIYKNSNIAPASKMKYGPQTRANLTERVKPNQKNNVDIGKKTGGSASGTGKIVSGMGGASGVGKSIVGMGGASGAGKPVTTLAKAGAAAKSAVNSVMKKNRKF
jgi:hypothetical protein